MAELKEYQYATENHPRVILGDPPGTGKTATTLHAANKQGFLGLGMVVLVPRAGLYTWYNQIRYWQPQAEKYLSEPITGLADFKTWELNDKIRISTFEAFKVAWEKGLIRPDRLKALIGDEIHRKFRKKTSKMFQFLQGISPQVDFMHLLSGTLIRHGAGDLWPPLNLVAPDSFRSYWQFVGRHCIMLDGEFGGKEILGVKDKEKLRREVLPWLVYRSRKTLLPHMPPKTRQALYVDPTPEQMKVYEGLYKDLVTMVGDQMIIAPSQLAALTRMRQVLVTPQIFDPSAPLGAGIPAILEHALEEREEPHFCIFVPFTDAIPPIEAALRRAGLNNVYTFLGRMKPAQVAKNETDFKATRGVAIISIDFAQSFNLETCSLGYFLGSSWNNDDNEQAEDRIYRMTSVNPVNLYYLMHTGTIEESAVMAVLDHKNFTSKDILGVLHA